MYIVIDKVAKEILHVNYAPLTQVLDGFEVYHLYNEDTMSTLYYEGSVLPEHWVAPSGNIRAMTDAELIEEGIIEAPTEDTE